MAETVPQQKTEKTDLNWSRPHWLSPLTRTWLLLVVFAFTVGRQVFENLQEHDWNLGQTLTNQGGFFSSLPGSSTLLGVIVLFFAVGLGLYYLGWFFTRFAIDDRALHLRTGVLNKSYRKANLTKIQSVDIIRNLLPRLLGLSEVRVDTADGDGSAVRLTYLSHTDAVALRARLLALVGEAKSGQLLSDNGMQEQSGATLTDDAVPDSIALLGDEETLLTRLPVGRQLAAQMLSGTTLLLIILLAAYIVWAISRGNFWSLTIANIMVVFGYVGSLWSSINRNYGFSTFYGLEGLKLRYGLTNTVTQSVPTGRIQALAITQPALWRFFGWYSVRVNVAGYGLAQPEDSSGGRTTVLPVATAEEVQRLLPFLMAKDEGIDARTILEAVSSRSRECGFTPAPKISRWFDWFSYRRNGFAVTEHFLLLRTGALRLQLVILPHDRVQSVQLVEGPLARRAGVATVSFHSVTGPITPSVANIAADDAARLAARY